MYFRAQIPMHEVAANTPEDVVAELRAIANAVEREGLNPYKLDQRTVLDLSYISYGTSDVDWDDYLNLPTTHLPPNNQD